MSPSPPPLGLLQSAALKAKLPVPEIGFDYGAIRARVDEIGRAALA
jgi:hypothetical protein